MAICREKLFSSTIFCAWAIGLPTRHGIFPRLNQWRREPGSDLVSQHEQPAIPLEFYLELMGNYYETWKKYGLPVAPHNSVHPETRIMGRGHGTYDDIILLNEVPDYEARVNKALREGLKGCVHAHANV